MTIHEATMTKFVNLCPHPLNIVLSSGECGTEGFNPHIMLVPASGTVCRVAEDTEALPSLLGTDGMIPVTYAEPGWVTCGEERFPTSKEVAYIVSRDSRKAILEEIVCGGCVSPFEGHRIYSPGPLLRDANGNAVGCHGLTAMMRYMGPGPWAEED